MSLALYFQYLYVRSNYFIANNIIAMCLAVYAIENWLVGSFRNIFLVFLGLIAYDVYFVFHSEVMMTVAKGIDLPLKYLMPVDSSKKQFTMIGTGDIIIPGLLCSMCLRYDLISAFCKGRKAAIAAGVKDKDELAPYIEKEMGCFYFYASIFGYLIGLAVTYAALLNTREAQPALLYILPS